jgi:hypothetical protein
MKEKPSIHSLGGTARMKKLGPAERSKLARKAAKARWQKARQKTGN